MTIWSAAILLFLVMDPFGNIPFFVAALREVEPARHLRVVARELLFALVVLVAFLFAGQHLLALLHVSGPALTVTGGLLLLLIAIKMIFPTDGHGEAQLQGEPFLVPLAIPYVAGPSALATVLLISSREPARWPEWLGALLLAWAGTAVVLATSGWLARRLGDRALTAIERLMGMLLVAVAVQMLMTGIAQFVRSLTSGA